MVTKCSYRCILIGILALFALSVLDSIDKTRLSRLSDTLLKGAALLSLTMGFLLIWGVLLRQKMLKNGPGHSVPWLTYVMALLFVGLSGLSVLPRLFSIAIVDFRADIAVSVIIVLLFVLILPLMSIHIESEVGHWKAGRFRIHESVIGAVCIITGILVIECGHSDDRLGLLTLATGAFLFGRDHVDVLNYRFVERTCGDVGKDDVNRGDDRVSNPDRSRVTGRERDIPC